MSRSRHPLPPLATTLVAGAALAALLALPACSFFRAVPDKASLSFLGNGRGSEEFNHALLQVFVDGATRPVVIELFPDDAPRHVANFKEKILSGHYEGTAFHRVIPRFVVQGGDPLTKDEANRADWGTGGNNETLPAEISRRHQRGSVAMARLTTDNPEKRSSASQFYITLGKRSELDGGYTVFGQVVDGLDVIDQIASTPTDGDDVPLARVEITRTALVPAQADIPDPGAASADPDRPTAVPPSQKGPFTRLIERLW